MNRCTQGCWNSTVSTTLSDIRTIPRWLLAVLALGLLLRVLFVTFHQRSPVSDEKEYDLLAQGLATTSEYSVHSSPTAYRPIGYPALLGLVYRAAGHHAIVMKYIQAVLDTSVGVIIFLILCGRSIRIASIGATMWAFYPPAILYTNLLLSETLFTFLTVAAVYLLAQLQDRKMGSAIALGIVLGTMILMKPGALIFLLVPILLFRILQAGNKTILVALATSILLVVPWMIRNYHTFGEFALTSNGGMNLLIGNHESANGAYNIAFDQKPFQNARSEFEADRIARDQALRYVVNEPDALPLLAVKKLAHFFESEGSLLVWSFHSQPEDTSTRFAAKYAEVPLLPLILTNLSYMLLLTTAVIGFIASEKERTWFVVGLLCLLWLSLHILFFGGSRFHFPVMPAAVLFAAPVLFAPFRILRRLSVTHKAVAIVTICSLLALWTYEGLVVFGV